MLPALDAWLPGIQRIPLVVSCNVFHSMVSAAHAITQQFFHVNLKYLGHGLEPARCTYDMDAPDLTVGMHRRTL